MTGTDILEIKRIEKAMKTEKFLQRIYTEKERVYILGKKNSPQTATGIFCGKEAVAKALGRGISDGITFLNMEIICDEKGAPHVTLNGRAAEIFAENKYKDISISISHCKSYAVAFCVIL